MTSRPGLLAAVALQLAAFTSQSLTGSAFLLLSLVWGLYCVPSYDKRHGPAVSKALWGAASGLSALALLLQLGVQLAFAAGTPGMRHPAIAKALQLLGFPHISTALGFVGRVAPLVAALVACTRQVQAARRHQAAVARREREGGEAAGAGRRAAPPLRVSSYTNAGVAAAAAVVGVAFAYPTLLALPHCAAVLLGVGWWAGARDIRGRAPPSKSGPLVALQIYTAAHLVTLYTWQWALFYFSWLRPLAELLGLYVIGAKGGITAVEVQQSVQLGSLAALFLALAYCVRASGRRHTPRGLTLVSRLLNVRALPREREQLAALQEPLIAAPQEEEQPPVTEPNSALHPAHVSWRAALLPAVVEVSVAAWTAVCSNVGVVAASACAVAMIRPSLLGGVALGAGTAALLLVLPRRSHLSHEAARLQCAGLLLWVLACYLATACAAALGVNAVADAVGVQAFAGIPFCPLMAMVLAAGTAAAHARSALPAAAAADLLAPGVQPQLQRILTRLTRGSSRVEDSGSETATPRVMGPSAAFGSPLSANSRELEPGDALEALRRYSLRFLWCAAFLALPATAFVVGTSHYAWLYGAYLAALLVQLASFTLRLLPSIRMVRAPESPHCLLRWYTAAVLAASYAAYVGGLDGFDHRLQPGWAKPWLKPLGLWDPAVTDMLSLLGLLLLATLHSSLAVGLQLAESGVVAPPSVEGVSTWHPSWLLVAARKSATYKPILLACAGYLLVLWDCDISALGLLYLAALTWVLAVQPRRGQWHSRSAAVSERHLLQCLALGCPGGVALPTLAQYRMKLQGAPAAQWLPLWALALLACGDFLAQAALPGAALLTQPFAIPTGVLAFLQSAIGISYTARGADLTLRLLRPTLVLTLLALYRYLYCLGALHRQLQRAATDEDSQQRQRLRKQLGVAAFLKRVAILHSSKVVAALAFAAAIQAPGGLGWLLVVGLVTACPALGAVKSGTVHRRPLLTTMLAGVQLVAAGWLLLQYTVQVQWLRDALAPYPSVTDALSWLGVDVVSDSAPEVMAHALLFKALLLLAVALKQRALRWHTKLPAPVREAAICGAACPLFWPPGPDYVDSADGDVPGTAVAQGARAAAQHPSLLQSARLVLLGAARRVRDITQQALRAVDWPMGQGEGASASAAGSELGGEEGEGTRSGTEAFFSPRQAGSGDAWIEERAATQEELQLRTAARLRSFRFAAQIWVEHWFAEWGLEASLLSLLLAAFSAANVLSLLCMVLVAAGMGCAPATRQAVWRWAVMPALALVLAWQYCLLVGMPPAAMLRMLHLPTSWPPLPINQDLEDWLALSGADVSTMWALFAAFGINALQLHYDAWACCARGLPGGVAPPPPASHSHSHSHSELHPLLAGGTGGSSSPAALWAPLRYSCQPQWQWHDWMRFLLYRRYLDVLLVTVILLCTIDNDLLHAGYLALALLFFRSRVALRSRRNALFRWLPLYNFGVMMVLLSYQAPFEDVWDWPLDDGQSCTVAHLLGLYKLRPTKTKGEHGGGGTPDPTSSLLAWGYEGALADLVLWAFIRVQTHLFSSPTYPAVVEVVEAEEEEARAAQVAQVAGWKAGQAAAAVEDARQRAARARRISRIKAGVDRSLGKFGAGISPTVLDWAFLDDHSQKGGPGTPQQTAPTPEQQHQQEQQLEAPQWQATASSSAGGGVLRRRGAAGAEASPPPAAAAESSRRGSGNGRGVLGFALSLAPSFGTLTEYEKEVAVVAQPSAPQGASDSSAAPAARAESPEAPQPLSPALHPPLSGWVRRLWSWLSGGSGRSNRRESALAYTLFVAAYVADFSLLTLVFPLSMFLYALVAVRPARAYWHAALLYSEALIIANYAYQVPARLGCHFITPQAAATAEVLGIHENATRCIPLFCCYLATLTHTYALYTRHAAAQRVAAAEGAGGASARVSRPTSQATLDSHPVGASAWEEHQAGGADSDVPVHVDLEAGEQEQVLFQVQPPQGPDQDGSDEALGEVVTSTVQSMVLGGHRAVASALASVVEFMLGACTVCERPPSYMLVTLAEGGGGGGEALQRGLQGVLDGWRARDVAAARQRRRGRRGRGSVEGEAGAGEEGSEEGEGWEELSEQRGSRSSSAAGSGSASSYAMVAPVQAPQQEELQPQTSTVALAEQVMDSSGGSPPASFPDLASLGPLHLRFACFVEEPAGGSAEAPHGQTRALVEVVALQGDPSNSPGISTAAGWPLRSLCPAAHAAATLLRGSPPAGGMFGQGGAAGAEVGRGAAGELPRVVAAEPRSRQARDWYASTAFLDILTFLFVAVYYNRVVQSPGSLSEITSQHVVPLGYLVTLMVLFMFVVLDRVAYSLGSPLAKALLHATEMGVYFWYCGNLFWSPGTHPTHPHLRVLMALRCGSFALGALQLRTGYPPPASYSNGMGRHTFIFMRSVSVPASAAFHAFNAIPFLYELRQLLDWSCTPTTLTLYDWFKLEDINMGLYFAAVMRRSRAWRRPGQRQPRYIKFSSGTLLFVGLLLLLWVPLLVFSTGNPTYQVPTVASFSVNVTLDALSAGGAARSQFPLYSAGDRRAALVWAGDNATLPAALTTEYTPDQLQLLCMVPDADGYWALTPPARAALAELLQDEEAGVAVSFGWGLHRDVPPLSDHGGPQCVGTASVGLAPESRAALLGVLRGEMESAPLLRLNGTGRGGERQLTPALYPVFWLMRGDACTTKPLQPSDIARKEALPARRAPPDMLWADRFLACNASLATSSDQPLTGKWTKWTERSDPPAPSGPVWWQLRCEVVDAAGDTAPAADDVDVDGRAACPRGFLGPRLVAVLDRVQGGIIGATLSRFGVIGLYSVFVYGIGRSLRLSLFNLRMRIPYEDLPTTRRLVALCQDIYLARAEGLLALEEELYSALISVYRLPSVMFELTKKGR